MRSIAGVVLRHHAVGDYDVIRATERVPSPPQKSTTAQYQLRRQASAHLPSLDGTMCVADPARGWRRVSRSVRCSSARLPRNDHWSSKQSAGRLTSRAARFLLAHTSSDLGETSAGLPFIVDMARLFELFVARWLTEHLPPGLVLGIQHRLAVGEGGRFASFVDLVLRDASGQVRAVLDTKFKDSDEPGPADLHQVVFYATGLGCSAAFLIYPRPIPKLSLQVGQVSISAIGFDLSTNLEDAGARFRDEVLSAINGSA